MVINEKLLNRADFIVETGTSGIWTYRKWSSGITECWTTSPIESGTHKMTANGNLYTSAEHAYSFPSNLFNGKPNLSMCVQQLGGMWGKTGGSTSKTTAIVQFLRTNSTTDSIQFNMSAIGRWK